MEFENDQAAVAEFLELMNDFIKNSIPEEMSEIIQ